MVSSWQYKYIVPEECFFVSIIFFSFPDGCFFGDCALVCALVPFFRGTGFLSCVLKGSQVDLLTSLKAEGIVDRGFSGKEKESEYFDDLG